MSLALTGGTGFVGRAVLDAAAAEGIEVRALTRKPQAERHGVAWVGGDLEDRAALQRLVAGTEAVIHVAGVVNAHDTAEFERGNVAGTLAMIETALSAGVQRFILVSSLSGREPELSAYGGSKARAERLLMASALDWTIVRPPAVYGPHDRELFELFRSAKWGVVPTPKQGRTSLIHADDLARLLLALVPGGDRVSHRILEPDDGQPGGWGHYELARAIGWAVGKRPWVVGLSRRAMERGARIDKLLRGRKAKLTLDRVGYMSHPDWAVSADAAPPPELWRPLVETRQGLKSTAEWYRRAGWL